MVIQKVNINDKLSTFDDFYNPRIIGELNGQYVKIAKMKGDFIMHKHDDEDELFHVVSGTLFIELEHKTLELNPGEFVIIPKGVNHKPYAPEEVSIMLFEPIATLNTGNSPSDLTRIKLEKI